MENTVQNNAFAALIATKLNIGQKQVQSVMALLEDGATIPFIARYRKEATGSLDEVSVSDIRNRLHQIKELTARRETILVSLQKNGHLSPELEAKVHSAETMVALEDIYLPYKPKRRTKGTIAREKGLEPLATTIFEQTGLYPETTAKTYINPEMNITTAAEALSGARDIMAETINEDQKARARLRDLFLKNAAIKSRVISGMEEKGAKFRDYFEWEEPFATVPSHRMLAIRRGESENILTFRILPEEDKAIAILDELFVKSDGADSHEVAIAAKDAYKRLLSHSMETEARVAGKKKADDEAIRVFSDNLRQLLLSPPLGGKRIMGIDPGFRTGCKLVCLDPQGKLLFHDTVFLHMSESRDEKEAAKIRELCEHFDIQAIAVGNGTAGRETESLIRKIDFTSPVQVAMVDESGASIYSASDIAREEFPDLDLTVRGSISIARRLMDPLAELVKIDPKSIGVGQYQHDVDQRALKDELDEVVTSCVNAVGVDLNRASARLLNYVSGLNATIAKNIIHFREENGPFASRKQLAKVPRMGPKTFVQCAGFLKISNSDNPLDASAVHPESYHIVHQMAKDLDTDVRELMQHSQLRDQIDLNKYVTDSVGLPTLSDIIAELARPGRDPRKRFEEFSFAEEIQKIEDLVPGMTLPGIVTNITAFGAFVDVGVHQDGLVHISQMADRFIKSPSEIVKVRQNVRVRVLEVDVSRKRISLSMKTHPREAEQPGSALENPKHKESNGQSEKPLKKSPKKTPEREKSTQTKQNRNQPFNNPFADALKKRK